MCPRQPRQSSMNLSGIVEQLTLGGCFQFRIHKIGHVVMRNFMRSRPEMGHCGVVCNLVEPYAERLRRPQGRDSSKHEQPDVLHDVERLATFAHKSSQVVQE